MDSFGEKGRDRKTYKYGESNYSPIVVHEKTGDHKKGTTVATPISPDWDRGKTKFRNKETFVSYDNYNGLEYVKKVASYYEGYHSKNWENLHKALDHLVDNDVYGIEAAEAVADAIQNGEDPLEALENYRKELLESLQQPLT